MNLTADICMIVHNDVSHDSRVLKEATSLAAHGYRVVVIGVTLKEHNLPELEEASGFIIWRVKPPLVRFRALGRMSMGLINRVALLYEAGSFNAPANTQVLVNGGGSRMFGFRLNVHDTPVAVATVGGEHARELEGQGEAAMVAAVL